MKEKILLAWSSGKDSARTLFELRNNDEYEVVALLTTMNTDYDRVSMHGVRRPLVLEQAKSIGLPLLEVPIRAGASNDDYESAMKTTLENAKQLGVVGVAFGDIFLDDLRQYREDKLAQIGMKAIFPIWKMDTTDLAYSFIDHGFRAVVTCVDTQVLDGRFSGRYYDKRLLVELPEGIDPCGENGEFHSFVYDGPVFSHSIEHTLGEIVLRDDRFRFCDVLPAYFPSNN